MHHLKYAMAAVALSVGMAPAFADVIMLDFEGIGDLKPVGNYYNNAGGPDYGVTFSNNALATVDSDVSPIWTGSIANEPSPNAVMSFLNGNHVVMNVAAGFDTGFSFYYSSSASASVTVYDGLDATGKVLAQLPLSAQFNVDCTGDPTGRYCNWTPVGASFDGIARSVSFAGYTGAVGFDNVTLGAVVPVPEPSEMPMLVAGMVALGLAARQRRTGMHG